MAHMSEIDTFLETWERESQGTIHVLESIPEERYAFRPDPEGRSIGEMAWHLCEIEGGLSQGIVARRFDPAEELPELKRPAEAKLLAPGYRRVHEDAVGRLRGLKLEELDEPVNLPGGATMTIRELLWHAMLHHIIHHRAQLVLLVRQAGGMPPGLFGPNREETQALRQKTGVKG